MKSDRSALAGSIVFAAVASLAAQNQSTDFPQWRGMNRDGVVAPAGMPQSWPERLTRKWKIEVGLGYATPVVIGNRVFMFARRGENEVLSALDADTGKQICESHYAVPFNVNPA